MSCPGADPEPAALVTTAPQPSVAPAREALVKALISVPNKRYAEFMAAGGDALNPQDTWPAYANRYVGMSLLTYLQLCRIERKNPECDRGIDFAELQKICPHLYLYKSDPPEYLPVPPQWLEKPGTVVCINCYKSTTEQDAQMHKNYPQETNYRMAGDDGQ